MKNANYCYFLQSYHDKRRPAGYFKVGVSSDWKKRIATINCHTPFPILRPVFVVKSWNARELEKNILSEFKLDGLGASGEWFHIPMSMEVIRGGIARTQEHREACDLFVEDVRRFAREWGNRNEATWDLF